MYMTLITFSPSLFYHANCEMLVFSCVHTAHQSEVWKLAKPRFHHLYLVDSLLECSVSPTTGVQLSLNAWYPLTNNFISNT